MSKCKSVGEKNFFGRNILLTIRKSSIAEYTIRYINHCIITQREKIHALFRFSSQLRSEVSAVSRNMNDSKKRKTLLFLCTTGSTEFCAYLFFLIKKLTKKKGKHFGKKFESIKSGIRKSLILILIQMFPGIGLKSIFRELMLMMAEEKTSYDSKKKSNENPCQRSCIMVYIRLSH